MNLLVKSRQTLLKIQLKHQIFKNISTTSYSKCPNIDKSQEPLVIIDKKADAKYVTLKLNRKPANSLSLDFFNEINSKLDKIEADDSVNGVILTSNIQNIYSAGLELTEIYKPKPERLGVFLRALQTLWLKLYGSNKIYISAINGHAIAGGCMIALACDYRIMSKGPYKIGLNETVLGIQVPFWLCNVMQSTIGNRAGEKALHFGELYTSDEALKLKLVDKVVDPDVLLTESEKTIQEWLKIPTMARQLTKSLIRKDAVDKLINVFDTKADELVAFLLKDETQKVIESYYLSLKNKKVTLILATIFFVADLMMFANFIV